MHIATRCFSHFRSCNRCSVPGMIGWPQLVTQHRTLRKAIFAAHFNRLLGKKVTRDSTTAVSMLSNVFSEGRVSMCLNPLTKLSHLRKMPEDCLVAPRALMFAARFCSPSAFIVQACQFRWVAVRGREWESEVGSNQCLVAKGGDKEPDGTRGKSESYQQAGNQMAQTKSNGRMRSHDKA